MARNVPLPIARQLRQLAGFGCCRCGIPVLQYHHIVPYSKEKHYRVKDMMALCPSCHDMATKGALTVKKQREHQKNPINIVRGYTQGLLIVNSNACVIKAGGVLLVGQGSFISVDQQSLISLTVSLDGKLELSINLYDKKDRPVAVIDKNEWVSGDIKLWDIKADHQKLKINKKKGQIALEINTQGDVISVRARLWYKGHSVRLSDIGLSFDNINSSVQNLAFVNQEFKLDTENKKVIIAKKGETGTIVSEADPQLRIEKAVEIWQKNYA